MIRVAINGFGRIGKTFLRAYLSDLHAQSVIQIVAINIGPNHKEWVAQLFKFDTFMGEFAGHVEVQDSMLVFKNHEIPIVAHVDPAQLDWKAFDVDWVIESSGKFVDREGASKHLKAGAKKVLITAIAQNPDVTVVMGVNERAYDKSAHHIVSLASCTANALFPIVKILHEACGLESMMTHVIHAYTNRQVFMDVEASNVRRSRSGALNIIPTDMHEPACARDVYPEFKGVIVGQSTRVPVAKVSLLDVACTVKKSVDIEILNDFFVKARDGNMKGILDSSRLPLVSSDYMNNPFSVVIDESLTSVSGSMYKVFGWFDNESGYSHRLKDFLVKLG